jgi:hypothetical protein
MASTDENDLPVDPRKLIPDQDWKAPDVIGTVEGWRTWAIEKQPPKFGVPPKLYSIAGTSGYYWVPRKKAIAECQYGCAPENVPGVMCGCGFYSAKTWEHLSTMPYPRYDAEAMGMFHVVGRVANWGRVIEGSLGWRAQFSYPVELWFPFEAAKLATGIKEAYGVKVRLVNFLRRPGTQYEMPLEEELRRA